MYGNNALQARLASPAVPWERQSPDWRFFALGFARVAGILASASGFLRALCAPISASSALNPSSSSRFYLCLSAFICGAFDVPLPTIGAHANLPKLTSLD